MAPEGGGRLWGWARLPKQVNSAQRAGTWRLYGTRSDLCFGTLPPVN